MNSKINSGYLILAGMILGAAFSRLIPHPPNFTAIGAMALFSGAYFNKKILAFAVPLTAMFLSDIVIGFHPGMYAVYTSFALIVLIGMTLNGNKKIGNIFLASVTASVAFFVITNFAMWATGVIYPKTAAGLVECFIAAIPFFHYTLLGDLLFVGLMFGSFEIIRAKFPSAVRVKI